jgi:hypothetical protein
VNPEQSPRFESLEPRNLLAGQLVASFGDAGTTALPRVPTQVFNLTDGNILVAAIGGSAAPSLARVTADGAADASFPSSTLLQTLAARIGTIRKLAIDSQNRLLAWGAGIGAAPVPALARVTPGGRIDRTFGKRGVIHLPFEPEGNANLFALNDGRVVVTGSTEQYDDSETDSRPWDMTVLATNGRIDTRFGGSGNGIISLGEISFSSLSYLPYSRRVSEEQVFRYRASACCTCAS